LILMIAERYELIIPTVRSRAQLVKFNKINDEDITSALNSKITDVSTDIGVSEVTKLASGNWNEAVAIIENKELSNDYFIKFRQWLRYCFVPKNHVELFAFNQELARMGREKQKSFLNLGLSIVHNSIMVNNNNVNAIKSSGEEFDFTKSFAPFINSANQIEIYKLLNDAIYHIERNAHAGILFTDLSLKLVRLLAQGKIEAKNK